MQMPSKAPKLRWKAAHLEDVGAVNGNPWRGLYAIYPFLITNEPNTLPPVRTEHTLCLVEINLFSFRNGAISDAGLQEIERIFAYYQAAGQEMIVRFVYDLDGEGLTREPEELRTILSHIRQLGSVLRRFSHSIYTLQGLLVGSWGEMHGSRHLDARSMTVLAKALDEAAGGDILLSVRCPNQWRQIFKTFDSPIQTRIFDGSLRSRVGLFNDAILASESDFGTYGELSRAQAPNYGTKRNREEELAFQNNLCLGVPNGGELVQGDGDFSIPETYRTFRLMMLSYLNEDFDMAALDRLRAARNISRDRCFRGASAYDYLTAHLGYRYRVCKTQYKQADKESITLKIQVENTGFAPCYFPMEASVTLRYPREDHAVSFPIPCDFRRLRPGETQWLTVRIPCTQLPSGDAGVALCILDLRSGKAVTLATALKGESASAALPLGQLRVRR